MSHEVDESLLGPSAHEDAPARLHGVEPTLSLSGGVTISLAHRESDLFQKLVVCFTKKGSISCERLMTCSSTLDMLALAEMEGTSLSEPALLAITGEDEIARTVYMTPAPGANFRDFAVWVGSVTETVGYLKARSVAIYLAKDSLDSSDIAELTCQFVRSLVEAKAVDEVSLFIGRHDYNQTLNLALSLKNELNSSEVTVTVLH